MEDRRGLQELTAQALHLTLALYRVTDLLPHEEPLRRGMREKAGEIFAAVVTCGKDGGAKSDADHAWVTTEILLGYLAIARTLDYTHPMNFVVLEREYRDLLDALSRYKAPAAMDDQPRQEAGHALRPVSPHVKKEAKPVAAKTAGAAAPAGSRDKQSGTEAGTATGDRQRAIIEHLSDKGQAKISDFYETFSDISSKTIQRDLQDLVSRNLIKKEGDRRWTVYTLV